MKLLLLDSPELFTLVAGWLGKADNYKWLDFGNGVQMVNPITLKIMTQRDIHVFRAYTADHGDVPAGVVGLTNVDRHFKYIGRQRQCHSIDGRPYDRLLFDLLATEHQDI